MHGVNGIMFADGYGGHYFVGTVLDFGISVVGNAAEGRQRRTFYVRKVIDDEFSVDVEFANYDEYKEFADWLLGYANNALAANSQVGAMRVAVPSQGFDKYGVLKTGITYGTNPQMIVFTMTLAFEGARDPASYNTAISSQFIPATGDVNNSAQYFYPGGTQLSGSDVPDNFYDVPVAGRTAIPTGSPLNLGTLAQDWFNSLTKPKPKPKKQSPTD